jgi:hypothetical protein
MPRLGLRFPSRLTINEYFLSGFAGSDLKRQSPNLLYTKTLINVIRGRNLEQNVSKLCVKGLLELCKKWGNLPGGLRDIEVEGALRTG